MKAEAEANSEADRKAKEAIDKKNAADAMVFQTEKQLKEFGDKLPADKRGAIEEALKEAKDALQKNDAAAIDAAQAKLTSAWQAASEELYKAQQAAGGAPGFDAAAGATGAQQASGDAQPQSDNKGAEDVEFEEVK